MQVLHLKSLVQLVCYNLSGLFLKPRLTSIIYKLTNPRLRTAHQIAHGKWKLFWEAGINQPHPGHVALPQMLSCITLTTKILLMVQKSETKTTFWMYKNPENYGISTDPTSTGELNAGFLVAINSMIQGDRPVILSTEKTINPHRPSSSKEITNPQDMSFDKHCFFFPMCESSWKIQGKTVDVSWLWWSGKGPRKCLNVGYFFDCSTFLEDHPHLESS